MNSTSPASPTPLLYSLHGLTVACGFPCPELPAAAGPPDVTIRVGDVPLHLETPRATGVLFEAAPDQYLLTIDGIARYWAHDGREIVVSPASDASWSDIRVFLLGTVVPALLYQRGALVLHGSGIAHPRGAVLFVGHSGRGKSTLLAALAARGFAVLTDDAAAITIDGSGRPVVHPGVPQVKLWKDAALRLGHRPEDLRRLRDGIEKFAMSVTSALHAAPLPLARIYEIDTFTGDGITFERVEDAARFMTIRAHTRNFRVVNGLGKQEAHFRAAAAVAAAVPIVRVRRPRGGDSLDALVARLLEDLA